MLGNNAPPPLQKNSKAQTLVWDGKDDAGVYVDDGPPNPRSIGGDEVALFQPNYVGVQTDRRLFIADAGNDRIVGVRLGHHAEASVALKNVRMRMRHPEKEMPGKAAASWSSPSAARSFCSADRV